MFGDGTRQRTALLIKGAFEKNACGYPRKNKRQSTSTSGKRIRGSLQVAGKACFRGGAVAKVAKLAAAFAKATGGLAPGATSGKAGIAITVDVVARGRDRARLHRGHLGEAVAAAAKVGVVGAAEVLDTAPGAVVAGGARIAVAVVPAGAGGTLKEAVLWRGLGGGERGDDMTHELEGGHHL